MSRVSVREAAFLTDKSRETVNNATKEGKLSFTLNGRGQKEIDIAELERVWPLVRTMAEVEQSGTVHPNRDLTASGPSDLKEQVAVLRERLDSLASEKELLKSERERERRQLESEIEHLRSTLEKAQEQHGKAMLLLTHESKEEEGREVAQLQKISELEARMQVLGKQNRRIYQELQQQKTKTFWQRLFA